MAQNIAASFPACRGGREVFSSQSVPSSSFTAWERGWHEQEL